MNSKVYKWCAVPLCNNTSIATPNKVFVHVPIKKEIRVTWLKLAQRNPDELSLTSTLYFCEDHFDLPNDMENYMEYHVMGSVSQVRMKIGCMPKNFICQPDRTTLTSDTTKRPNIVNIQRMMTQQDCKKHFEEESIVKEQISSEEIASSSSVQHKIEEVPHLTPRVLDTSIPLKMFKAFKSKANKTQLPNDMANYMRYRIVGTVAQVRMIPSCTPTKFECQPDRKRSTCGGKERPFILKKKRMKAVEECMNKSEIKNTSCSSLLDTSNINFQTVEEHAAEVLYKEDEKSFQMVANKKEIKEDFDLHESQDDVLNLHTHIDIKQEDNEDIDASVPNLTSASSSRTNSACGSPSRESHVETFTEHDPLNTMDVIVMKEEPGSPSSNISIQSRRDIEIEVAADIYQQHTKKQSQQKIQLTQIRYANAERQRRYRAKIKADKINAYTRFNASSDVQQQTQNIQINRRPQTNAERTRKHRQLLPEKQQQQMEEMNVFTVMSKKNVDPVAHARNTRKRHLNKVRPSRFRDRQRFINSTSSQQAQELGTQEKFVDDDSHEHALEDLHSSDPSDSAGSCSQTILTLRKIKENFDLQEKQDDDNLNLHTHIDIKQDVEDIDTSVPNFFPASSSQTNSACGGPSRELHIETFTEHDPLNTMDVIVMKEEPGSPSSDVSIHFDAADSPEDIEAIEIKLRKKMEILSQNEEIIKSRREEISILEKSNKKLLAEIKYLQNVSKKKC